MIVVMTFIFSKPIWVRSSVRWCRRRLFTNITERWIDFGWPNLIQQADSSVGVLEEVHWMRKSLTLIQAQWTDLSDPLTGRRAAFEILYSSRLWRTVELKWLEMSILFTPEHQCFSSSVLSSASLVQIFHLLYISLSFTFLHVAPNPFDFILWKKVLSAVFCTMKAYCDQWLSRLKHDKH